MTFALPNSLWLLLLVPAMTAFLVWAWRRKERLISQFVQSRLLAELTVGVSKSRQKARLGLLVAALTLVILALARPQWGFKWEEATQRGLDIVVAIDASRSMLARDLKPNRLERAKLAAMDLMRLAQTDRLGLVTFAGTAFLQCPLTLDEEAFRQSLDAIEPGIMPQGGTSLAETIGVALGAFKNEGDNYKILVLFSDGEDHEEGALEAAQSAAKDDLRIFTIGVGTPEGELIPVAGPDGREDYLKDSSGNVVKSRLNETLLQQIAGAASGFYLNLRGVDTIETLYQRGLAPLPKGEFTARLVRRYYERFYWPLLLAVVLLLVEMFLPEHKRRGRGRGVTTAATGVAAVLLLLGARPASASSSEARQKFEAGKFEESFAEYRKLRDKKPEDCRLHFNTGAAAYRAGDFEEAARNFSAAGAAEDRRLQQSAWYNLGNSFYHLGEHAGAPDQKSEAWKGALRVYEEALKLKPDDADAKHNRDFVKLKLEELQQQQQQKPDDKKDDEKKDKEKQDDQKQDQPNEPKDGKQDDSKKQGDSKDDQKKQPEQPKPDESKPDEKAKQPEQPKQQPANDGKKGNEPQAPPPQQAAAGQPAQMTPEQAAQFLDSQKGEQRALIFQPPQTNSAARRFLKTW